MTTQAEAQQEFERVMRDLSEFAVAEMQRMAREKQKPARPRLVVANKGAS
jgi:hypothetical protein